MSSKTKRRSKLQALFDELAASFRAAPIIETRHEYHDVFDRAHSRVSVELCHGVWHTFYREFAGIGNTPYIKSHASRNAARAWARDCLTRP
jgi:hypothetical protein